MEWLNVQVLQQGEVVLLVVVMAAPLPPGPGGITTPGEVLTTPCSSHSLPPPSQTNSACRLWGRHLDSHSRRTRVTPTSHAWGFWKSRENSPSDAHLRRLQRMNWSPLPQAAPCFCISESFKTYRWVWSNVSKFRGVTVNMLELYLSGTENLV